MKIIITGAGELGQQLANTLCSPGHDLVIIDLNDTLLTQLKERLDVMTFCGNSANVDSLVNAGVEGADVLLAVSNDDTGNILTCMLAKKLGVKRRICRLSSYDYFSEEKGITPEVAGIDQVVIPDNECIEKIINVLENRIILEKILFSDPNASMVAFEVLADSPLKNIAIKDFPESELIKEIRFASIIRGEQRVMPHGETVIQQGDRIYIAGRKEAIEKTLEMFSPEDNTIKRVIIAGLSRIGQQLACRLVALGYKVRIIEKDMDTSIRFLDNNLDAGKVMIINGDASEREVMEEVGIETCDAFISALDLEEANILNCVLAKRSGAKKVVALTTKSEYEDIISAIDLIDCEFNSSLVSINTILRSLGTGSGVLPIDAILHRTNACVFEFLVEDGSAVSYKKIRDCDFPQSTIISLVFRNGEVVPATGFLELLPGDAVVIVTTTEVAYTLQRLFLKNKTFLGLKL